MGAVSLAIIVSDMFRIEVYLICLKSCEHVEFWGRTRPELTQSALEARQKVARGKRLCARPLDQIPQNHRALERAAASPMEVVVFILASTVELARLFTPFPGRVV